MIALVHKYKYIILGIFSIFVVLSIAIPLTKERIIGKDTNVCPDTNINAQKRNVSFSNATKYKYDIELATTISSQDIGLSSRSCFPLNGALIFLFPVDDKFGIWMKNMNFPIDVVWLDKDKKVVTILKDMQPSSYPKSYYPSSDARFVIELNSGQVDKAKIQEGQTLNW